MRVHLKPAEGLKVRQPDGQVLPEEGKEVELTTYWRRRLRDGDVVEIKPATGKKKEA